MDDYDDDMTNYTIQVATSIKVYYTTGMNVCTQTKTCIQVK